MQRGLAGSPDPTYISSWASRSPQIHHILIGNRYHLVIMYCFADTWGWDYQRGKHLSLHPCADRTWIALGVASAITETTLWCPRLGSGHSTRPEETNKTLFPDAPFDCCFRLALSMVMVVPCTMPWGPIYMNEPAVICPYWNTQGIHPLPIIFGWIIRYNHPVGNHQPWSLFMRRNNPRGWPEYRTRVCSSVIVARYFIVSRYCAHSGSAAPFLHTLSFAGMLRNRIIQVIGKHQHDSCSLPGPTRIIADRSGCYLIVRTETIHINPSERANSLGKPGKFGMKPTGNKRRHSSVPIPSQIR